MLLRLKIFRLFFSGASRILLLNNNPVRPISWSFVRDAISSPAKLSHASGMVLSCIPELVLKNRMRVNRLISFLQQKNFAGGGTQGILTEKSDHCLWFIVQGIPVIQRFKSAAVGIASRVSKMPENKMRCAVAGEMECILTIEPGSISRI